MKTYLVLFLAAGLLSFLITPLVLRISERWGIGADPVGARKVHRRPVPRLGGVAIYLSVLGTVSLLFLHSNEVTEVFQSHLREIAAIFAASTLVFLVGLADDLRGLRPWAKLAGHAAAALLLIALGLEIREISSPFGGETLALGWLSLPITLLWLVGLTNAFNMVDGLDGLADGLAFLIALFLCLISLISGKALLSIFALTVAGATLGFLRYNFHPARIFMGDGGSNFLGFLLAALAVRTSQKSSVLISLTIPLLIMGVPLLESAMTVLRRLLAGQPLMQGDLAHIHHMLLSRGRSQRTVVFGMYGLTVAFGLAAFAVSMNREVGAAAVAVLLAGLLLALIFTRLGYPEFHELGALLWRLLFFQKRILRNQIYIRRISASLGTAGGPRELFQLLSGVFARLGFARAQLQVTVACANPGWRTYWWTWTPGGREEEPGGGQESSAHREHWTLRIPLVSSQRLRAQLNLERSAASEPLYFQVYSLVDLFSRRLGEALGKLPAEQLEEFFRLAAAAPEPRQVEARPLPRPGGTPALVLPLLPFSPPRRKGPSLPRPAASLPVAKF